jgi:flagellar basal-body rod protein FlgF
MGAIEIAEAILSRASQRVELSAHNLSNITTPAYKAHRPFAVTLQNSPEGATPSVDFTIGKLRHTGNPLDIAISGSGFFAVRSGDAIYYTRNGQFALDDTGRLVTGQGMAVQSSGGGDVVIDGAEMTVLADGTVLANGAPVARLMVVDFDDLGMLRPASGGVFTALEGAAMEAASPMVRQGMLETSNVSSANEMLSLMAALRSAQSGQRVIQIYDDLMGRALTAFGQM